MTEKYSEPEKLSHHHDTAGFDCGEPSLNDWLKRNALKNQASNTSRTFVITCKQDVIGYYCLAAGAMTHEQAPKKLRRNQPNPSPVLILGRLAIDQKYHNQGLGSALLRDAMLRAIHLSRDMGVFSILVHAISDEAKQFYLSRGFVESPLQPRTLMMTLATIATTLIKSPV